MLYRKLSFGAAIIAAIATTACSSDVLSPDAFTPGDALRSGNGAPRGAHDYQLNIIGTSTKNDNTVDDWGGNGHRIFVYLEGRTKILLEEGPFQVLDANGTDGEAKFALPAPGLDAYVIGDPGDADVESAYSVFIRPLGKPGGWATMTTCAELLDIEFGNLLPGGTKQILNRAEGDAYCSIEQVGADILTRGTGQSKFTNVTAELTTIVFEVTVEVEEGVFETFQVRVPLFDALIEGEYWEYDNNGLRLAQVRFYDCSTNVETGASTCE